MVELSEPLQVIRFEQGDFSNAHHDSSPSNSEAVCSHTRLAGNKSALSEVSCRCVFYPREEKSVKAIFMSPYPQMSLLLQMKPQDVHLLVVTIERMLQIAFSTIYNLLQSLVEPLVLLSILFFLFSFLCHFYCCLICEFQHILLYPDASDL